MAEVIIKQAELLVETEDCKLLGLRNNNILYFAFDLGKVYFNDVCHGQAPNNKMVLRFNELQDTI